MFCSKCGKEISDQAKFCGKCGAKSNIQPIASEGFGRSCNTVVSNESATSNPREKSKKSNKLVIAVIAIVVCVAVVAASLLYLITTSSNNQGTNQGASQQKVENNQSSKVLSTPVAAGSPLAGDDLNLAGLKINGNLEQANSGLGKCQSQKQTREGTVSTYGLTELTTVANGKIINITTEDPKCASARGVRVGDSLSTMTSAYGNSFTKMTAGDLDIYEYSLDYQGSKCVLRFAIKKSDNRISYIGLRNATATDAAYN